MFSRNVTIHMSFMKCPDMHVIGKKEIICHGKMKRLRHLSLLYNKVNESCQYNKDEKRMKVRTRYIDWV